MMSGPTKCIIRKWSIQEQNKVWHNIQSRGQAKQLMLGVNIRLSKYVSGLSRRDVRTLITIF